MNARLNDRVFKCCETVVEHFVVMDEVKKNSEIYADEFDLAVAILASCMSKDKTNLMIITPKLSVVWFFCAFLVVFVQVKNSMCPEWLLNLFELFATVLFGIYAIVNAILFIVSGFQNFSVVISLGFITYSAISLAHSKRTK